MHVWLIVRHSVHTNVRRRGIQKNSPVSYSNAHFGNCCLLVLYQGIVAASNLGTAQR